MTRGSTDGQAHETRSKGRKREKGESYVLGNGEHSSRKRFNESGDHLSGKREQKRQCEGALHFIQASNNFYPGGSSNRKILML